jgi:hypothetical protein
MMSAPHQTPHGFPRYRRDRVDSSFEKEASLRGKKLFLHSQRTYTEGGWILIFVIPALIFFFALFLEKLEDPKINIKNE